MKPATVGALLRASRRDLGDVEAARTRTLLNSLAGQLAIDAAAIRQALAGPDPQFAIRVVLDSHREHGAALDVLAAGFAPARKPRRRAALRAA